MTWTYIGEQRDKFCSPGEHALIWSKVRKSTRWKWHFWGRSTACSVFMTHTWEQGRFWTRGGPGRYYSRSRKYYYQWTYLCFLILLLLNYFYEYHIKYVKPALTRGLTARDSGGPWAGAHFHSPKSGPVSEGKLGRGKCRQWIFYFKRDSCRTWQDITQLFRIKVSLWLSCEVIPCQAKSLTTVCLKQGSHAILNTNLYTFSGLKLLRMAYPGRIQALWQLPRWK